MLWISSLNCRISIKNGVDVPFNVVHRNQRDSAGEAERLLRKVIPTSRDPTNPGPAVTAIAARDCNGVLASLQAPASPPEQWNSRCALARRARAPRRRIWHVYLIATRPPGRQFALASSITAAAVSSQELSMPRIRTHTYRSVHN